MRCAPVFGVPPARQPSAGCCAGMAATVNWVTNAVVAQIFGIQHMSMLSGFIFFSHHFILYCRAKISFVISYKYSIVILSKRKS